MLLDQHGTPIEMYVPVRRVIGFTGDEYVELKEDEEVIVGIKPEDFVFHSYTSDGKNAHPLCIRGRSAGMPPQRKHPLPGRE